MCMAHQKHQAPTAKVYNIQGNHVLFFFNSPLFASMLFRSQAKIWLYLSGTQFDWYPICMWSFEFFLFERNAKPFDSNDPGNNTLTITHKTSTLTMFFLEKKWHSIVVKSTAEFSNHRLLATWCHVPMSSLQTFPYGKQSGQCHAKMQFLHPFDQTRLSSAPPSDFMRTPLS